MNWNEMLNAPITKMTDKEFKAQEDKDLAEVVNSGEEKKQRVLRFLEANYNWPIAKIVQKFDLYHDVIKDFGNDLVQAGFYADESMRVLCFDLTMPYDELRAL